MTVIGLTGNIGSGKSTVARYLQEHGAEIIDTDRVAREVVEPGKPAWQEIVDTFGREILQPDGTLDRRALGRLVFGDPAARARLNAIVHPRIREEVERRKRAFHSRHRDNRKVLVVEAPLLIEAGMQEQVDQIWLVVVDPEEQLQRVMSRDGLSREDALARINAQMPQGEKLRHAHVVIDNSGTPEETRRQVAALWAKLNGEQISRSCPPYHSLCEQ
ncbi:MAG TPA: dephospho-CoA kinase [Desulfotomaculum sp.]|nr:dephospho-CoA kinase [Desulfotomaculum sp.]